MALNIQVRTDNPNSKLLFEWDPENDVIEIVRKSEKIRVKLCKNDHKVKYRILDRLEKN